MNDATKNALNEFVQRMLDAANAGMDFASTEVPLLVGNIATAGKVLIAPRVVVLEKFAETFK